MSIDTCRGVKDTKKRPVPTQWQLLVLRMLHLTSSILVYLIVLWLASCFWSYWQISGKELESRFMLLVLLVNNWQLLCAFGVMGERLASSFVLLLLLVTNWWAALISRCYWNAVGRWDCHAKCEDKRQDARTARTASWDPYTNVDNRSYKHTVVRRLHVNDDEVCLGCAIRAILF